MLRTTIMMVLLAGQALAGPWPREKGRTFLAVAGFAEAPETGQSVTGYATVYAEYGLTDTVTVGLDLGSDEDATEKIIGFLRVPLIPADRSLKFALELGAGRLDGGGVVRPGMSLGHGLKMFGRNGWFAIDTRGEVFVDGGATNASGDVTLGLSATEKTKVILQLQGGTSAFDDTFLRLAPSMIREFAPGRHIEFGITAGLKDAADFGIKLGSWLEF